MINKDRIDQTEIGERLKIARSKANFSQAEAAEKLKLARTTLLSIEKGHRALKNDEFRSLCELYKVSANELLRPSSIHVDLVPRFRALNTTLDKAADKAAKLLNDLAASEIELEQLLGYKPIPRNYPPEKAILPGDVKRQAEDDALELRHRLGLGLSPITDIVSLLEDELGVRVFLRPLHSKISGLFAYDENLGACILLNKNHPRERRIQTGCHEVGHLISARYQPEISQVGYESNMSREEKYATYFGIALTMPASLVRKKFHDMYQQIGRFTPQNLILLAHYLNVSEEALCRRLEELTLIPKGTWESLKERGFSSEQVRQVLGDKPENQNCTMPPRIWLLAALAYDKDLLSEGQLAKMLHMDRVELREILDTLDINGSINGDIL